MAYPTTHPHPTAEDVVKELSLIGITAYVGGSYGDTVKVTHQVHLAKLYELAQAEWDRTRGGAS